MAVRAFRMGDPRSPYAKSYSNAFRDLWHVMDIMRACDITTNLGEEFYADPLIFNDVRLPGKLFQKDSTKSEEPSKSGDEEVEGEKPLANYWKIYVHDAPGRNKYWTIPEFYAAHVAKKPIARLKPGVQMAWGLRALYESGALGSAALPTVRTVRLPESKIESRKTLYEGFIYLVRLRLLYNPQETDHPFSYDFIHRWCGIWNDNTINNGLRWLRENGYIRIVRRVTNPPLADTHYYDFTAPSVSSLAKDKDVIGLIEVFRDFDGAVREEALDELIKLGQMAVEPLVVALTDEDEQVSNGASAALRRIREPSVQPLIASLAHANDKLRTEVIYLLGLIGGDEVLRALLSLLEDDNVEAQLEAIKALAGTKNKGAVEPLRKIVQQSSDEGLRHSAEQAANEILGLPTDDWWGV